MEFGAVILFMSLWFLMVVLFLFEIRNEVKRTNRILDKIFKACSYKSADEVLRDGQKES